MNEHVRSDSPLAFLFPGQGSQEPGMGKALADAFPAARRVFDSADEALGEPLSRLCFEGPVDALALTANTQPAILTCSVAAWTVVTEELGLVPTVCLGHSLGEFSALVAAGALAFKDAVPLVRFRAQAMQEAVPAGEGAMAAVMGLEPDAVHAACAEAAQGEVVEAANLNAPGQIVIAGSAAAVARAGERAKALGAKRVIPLQVSAPFHCALMRPAEVRLTPELRAVAARDPRVPVVANVDAAPKTDAVASIDALIRQVSAPVRWEDCVRRLASAGVTAYVEVGPGTVLSGLVKKIARDAVILNLDAPEGLAPIEALAAASGSAHA